jgi:hypothetical protein
MKKFIFQLNLTKTEELKQLKTEREQQQEISVVANGKSDIIVSFDKEYLDPVISQKKTYEFRS